MGRPGPARLILNDSHSRWVRGNLGMGSAFLFRGNYSAFFLLFLAVYTSSFGVFIEYDHHLFSDSLLFYWWLLSFWVYAFHVLCIDTDGSCSEAGSYWGFSLLFYCCFCFSFCFLWFFCVIQLYLWFWFQLKDLLPVLRPSDFLVPIFIVQKGRAKLGHDFTWLV